MEPAQIFHSFSSLITPFKTETETNATTKNDGAIQALASFVQDPTNEQKVLKMDDELQLLKDVICLIDELTILECVFSDQRKVVESFKRKVSKLGKSSLDKTFEILDAALEKLAGHESDIAQIKNTANRTTNLVCGISKCPTPRSS